MIQETLCQPTLFETDSQEPLPALMIDIPFAQMCFDFPKEAHDIFKTEVLCMKTETDLERVIYRFTLHNFGSELSGLFYFLKEKFRSFDLNEYLEYIKKIDSTLINETYFANIARHHEIGAETDMKMIYDESNRTANLAVEQMIANTFPKLSNRVGLLNSTSLRIDPFELFCILASDKHTPRLKFEYIRRWILASTEIDLLCREKNEPMFQKLSEVVTLLDAKLYGPDRIGDINQTSYTTTHNPSTNEALSWQIIPLTEEPNSHTISGLPIKTHNVTARTLRANDHPEIMIVTHSREKSHASALLKALSKSMKDGKIIDISKMVQDAIGISFTILGTKTEKQLVIENVLKTITDKFSDVDIKDRSISGVNKGRGSSLRNSFKRMEIYFKDISVPLEIIFRDVIEATNAELDVGYFEEKTSSFTGASHRLYEINRNRPILDAMFPAFLYGDDLEGYINANEIATARNLVVN